MSGNDALFRLTYVSRNGLPGDAAAREAGTASILAVARRNNARLGVTGALLFTETCFAQVLEGPLATIEELFETIQCDSRHAEVVVLLAEPVAERAFGDWSMAFAGRLPESAVGMPAFDALAAARPSLRESVAARLLDVLRGAMLQQDMLTLPG
ncbi:MAG TPA: BLUF domain-containing protein [Acetobacteraceae bacterium]|nr:BLUF domain-containing protein [Acetobacteraceae bacterium]